MLPPNWRELAAEEQKNLLFEFLKSGDGDMKELMQKVMKDSESDGFATGLMVGTVICLILVVVIKLL